MRYPQAQALLELKGVGVFTALLIVAEFGDVTRFRRAKQAAAYTGLTTRVFQSGEHTRTGHISKQGSSFLRWVMVELAMQLVKTDRPLANFSERIRKRSDAKLARVAAGRKVVEICWMRLMRWQHLHATAAA